MRNKKKTILAIGKGLSRSQRSVDNPALIAHGRSSTDTMLIKHGHPNVHFGSSVEDHTQQCCKTAMTLPRRFLPREVAADIQLRTSWSDHEQRNHCKPAFRLPCIQQLLMVSIPVRAAYFLFFKKKCSESLNSVRKQEFKPAAFVWTSQIPWLALKKCPVYSDKLIDLWDSEEWHSRNPMIVLIYLRSQTTCSSKVKRSSQE